MATTDSDPALTQRKRGTLTMAMWIALLLLVLYALSPAPVFKMFAFKPPWKIRAIYIPLGYIEDSSPQVREFYIWWFHLWGDPTAYNSSDRQ
jgi:hypothetical protein